MFNSFFKRVLLILLLCLCSRIWGSDHQAIKLSLARLDNLLNRVENIFWNGLTAPPASRTRGNLTNTLAKLQSEARRLQDLLRMAEIYGVSFTDGSTKLQHIPSNFRCPTHRRQSISLKKSSDALYFKRLRRGLNRREQKAIVKITDLDDYQNFINEVTEYNRQRLTSRYENNRELSNSQQRVMLAKAEEYLSALASMRMASAKLKRFLK